MRLERTGTRRWVRSTRPLRPPAALALLLVTVAAVAHRASAADAAGTVRRMAFSTDPVLADDLLKVAPWLDGQAGSQPRLRELQRLLDAGHDSAAPSSEPVTRSLHDVIEERMAAAPAVLEAYMRSYEAEAAGRLQAAGLRNEELLRETAARFFFTRAGGEAALRLAGRLADRRRFDSARFWLQKLLRLHPAAPLARDELKLLLARLPASAPLPRPLVFGPRTTAPATAVDAPPVSAKRRRAQPEGPWRARWMRGHVLGALGDPARSGAKPDATTVSILSHLLTNPSYLPVTVAGNRAFTCVAGVCTAYDLDTGALCWQQHDPVSMRDIPLKNPATGSGSADRPLGTLRALFRHPLNSMISTGDGAVYILQDTLPLLATWFTDIRFTGNSLTAVDMATGVVRWRRGRSGPPGDPLKHAPFFSRPLVKDGRVMVCGIHDSGDWFAAAFDTATGKTEWLRLIDRFRSSKDRQYRHYAVALLGADADLVYACIGHGLLTALDAETGLVRWVAAYPQMPRDARASDHRKTLRGSAGAAYLHSAMVCRRDLVILWPPDGEALVAIRRTDGRVRWTTGLHPESVILGVTRHGRLIVQEPLRVRCIEPATGRTAWTANRMKTAIGATDGEAVYFPKDDAIDRLDARTGRPLDAIPLAAAMPGLATGMLTVHGDRLLASTYGALACLQDEGRLLAALTSSSPSYEQAMQLARLHLAREDIADAERAARLALNLAREDAQRQPARDVLFDALLCRAESDPEAPAAILAEAAALPIDPRRRARLNLALAASAHRQGRHADAVRTWLAIAAAPSPGLLATEGGRLEQQPGALAAAALRACMAQADTAASNALERVVRGARTTLAAGNPVAAASWLVRAMPRSGVSLDAASALLAGDGLTPGNIAGEVLLLNLADDAGGQTRQAAEARLAAWRQRLALPAPRAPDTPRLPALPWTLTGVLDAPPPSLYAHTDGHVPQGVLAFEPAISPSALCLALWQFEPVAAQCALCLALWQPDTGRRSWRLELPAPFDPIVPTLASRGSMLSPYSVFCTGRMAWLTIRGGTYAVDLALGRLHYAPQDGPDILNAVTDIGHTQHGVCIQSSRLLRRHSGTGTIDDTRVVQGRDLLTGNLLWRRTIPGLSRPLIHRGAYGVIIANANGLTVVDPLTGTLRSVTALTPRPGSTGLSYGNVFVQAVRNPGGTPTRISTVLFRQGTDGTLRRLAVIDGFGVPKPLNAEWFVMQTFPSPDVVMYRWRDGARARSWPAPDGLYLASAAIDPAGKRIDLQFTDPNTRNTGEMRYSQLTVTPDSDAVVGRLNVAKPPSKGSVTPPYSPVNDPSAPFTVVISTVNRLPVIEFYARPDGSKLGELPLPPELTRRVGSYAIHRVLSFVPMQGRVVITTAEGIAIFEGAPADH